MATAMKVKETKVDSAEWWAEVPNIPDPEPTLASITFNSGEEARRFGTVLQQVVAATAAEAARPVLNCVQMQTAQGLRFVAADGFRLGVAEYRPGLRDAENKVSDILARPVLFDKTDVLAISKVLRSTLAKRRATLEVRRDGEQRTLIAANDKGQTATASEQPGTFPDWRQLIPTKFEVEPAALNASYLQWVGRFCEAVNDDSGAARIIHLHPIKPARIDTISDEYRGIAVVMPMLVDLGSPRKNGRRT